MQSRLDEVLPEGIIYACPVCGREALFHCRHEDYWESVLSIQMPIEQAMDLRQNSGYYEPSMFTCTGCGEEKELGLGCRIGNGITCKECIEGTNTPKIGDYKIPFSPEGDQMYFTNHYSLNGIDFRDNYVFVGALTLETQERGRSAAHFILKDEDGKRLYMFLKEMVEVIKRRGIQPGGIMTGRWTFVKRGQNYGVRPV